MKESWKSICCEINFHESFGSCKLSQEESLSASKLSPVMWFFYSPLWLTLCKMNVGMLKRIPGQPDYVIHSSMFWYVNDTLLSYMYLDTVKFFVSVKSYSRLHLSNIQRFATFPVPKFQMFLVQSYLLTVKQASVSLFVFTASARWVTLCSCRSFTRFLFVLGDPACWVALGSLPAGHECDSDSKEAPV